MILPFTGKWKNVQHIKNKPHNTGIKIFCLADHSKYLWDFWLYQGKKSERSTKPTDIVMDFVEKVEQHEGHRAHIMVVDSYYGSLKLGEALNNKLWGALISCKADRPAMLFTNNLHEGLTKGTAHAINNYQFSAISYYDRAKLNLITNLFVANKDIYSSNSKKVSSNCSLLLSKMAWSS